jgi:hypothetical protein
MFDRYLWPLVLPIAFLLLTKPTMLAWSYPADVASRQGSPVSLPARAFALGLLAVIGSTSLALALNASAFNGARWRLGEAAVRRGAPAESIDAGIEWVGTYAPGRAYPDTPPGAHPGTWYDNMYPSFRLCEIVSSSPIHLSNFSLETADKGAYRLLLVAGKESPLYLYRAAAPGCQPG